MPLKCDVYLYLSKDKMDIQKIAKMINCNLSKFWLIAFNIASNGSQLTIKNPIFPSFSYFKIMSQKFLNVLFLRLIIFHNVNCKFFFKNKCKMP